ncbi:MAG TPA: histidine kinase [Thermoleophilaceae bacterium]|nr:histidine kinase [Thermoleophilaceae bacterium]
MRRASPPADRRTPTLLWRVFATNAVVITAIFLGLALTPATVDSPVPLHLDGVLSMAGLVLLLVVNFLIMRREFAPLDRLTRFMGRVDPLRPGQRIPAYGHAREVEELTRAFNDMLDRLEDERRESGRRELAAQENERRRLARELHDEIGQRLTGLLLQLEYLIGGATPETQGRLLGMRESVRAALEEVGGVAARLRPPALDDLGLASALAALTERLSEHAPFPIGRSLAGDLPPLSPDTELVLYRIAQEALTNALRHADASRVDLGLRCTPTGVALTVTDDGRGLNGAVEGPGLAGMRERAMLVGADFEVVERSVGGVEVRLEVAREGIEQ